MKQLTEQEKCVAWVKETFGDTIDTRLAKNGDGNDWMSWGMAIIWRTWQHRTPPAITAKPVPAGWKIVPVEPTVEMYNAWVDCRMGFYEDYAAILAAAPAPGDAT